MSRARTCGTSLIVVIAVVIALSFLTTTRDTPSSAPPVVTRVVTPTTRVEIVVATPTRLPLPTSRPAPTQDDGIQHYADQMMPILNGYSTDLQKLTELATLAGDNPLLIYDDDWRMEIVITAALIQLRGKELRAITSPPQLSSVHSESVAASKHFDRACDLLLEGIDDQDGEKLARAANEMQAGSANMAQAKKNLDGLGYY